MALLKKLQRPTLRIYLTLNWHIRPHADQSAIIFVKESCLLQNQNYQISSGALQFNFMCGSYSDHRHCSFSLQITSTTYVCSAHFLPADFKRSLVGRRLLKKTAVPSVFPWTKTKKSRPSAKDTSGEKSSTTNEG